MKGMLKQVQEIFSQAYLFEFESGVYGINANDYLLYKDFFGFYCMELSNRKNSCIFAKSKDFNKILAVLKAIKDTQNG